MESIGGLMDKVLDPEDVTAVEEVLATYRSAEVQFHEVRTRMAGHQRFVAMHVLVPGSWSVQKGHDLLEDVEDALMARLDHLRVDTHLEPIEDPRAYEAELGVEAPEAPPVS